MSDKITVVSMAPTTPMPDGPMTEELKHAITRYGRVRDLGRRAGVSDTSISLFMTGRRHLSWANAERLLVALGYELKRPRKAVKPEDAL